MMIVFEGGREIVSIENDLQENIEEKYQIDKLALEMIERYCVLSIISNFFIFYFFLNANNYINN